MVAGTGHALVYGMTSTLPLARFPLATRMAAVIGSNYDPTPSPLVTPEGELTALGRIVDQSGMPFMTECLAYARLVGLVEPRGLLAGLTTENERLCDVIRSREGRPTVPPVAGPCGASRCCVCCL